MAAPIKIFLSYAHTNATSWISEVLCSEFTRRVQEFNELNIELIYDIGFLIGGDQWDQKIKENIASCKAILFLINEKFHTSTYIKSNEFEETIKRKDVVIFHNKLFVCSDYTGLGGIQSIMLNNNPIFEIKETAYAATDHDRAKIKMFVDSLYNCIRKKFIPPKPIISNKNEINFTQESNIRINREKEMGVFSGIVRNVDIKNNYLFCYQAIEDDRPNYYNYRLNTEVIKNSLFNGKKPDMPFFIDPYSFSIPDDKNLLANIVYEIVRLYFPEDKLPKSFAGLEGIRKCLHDLLNENNIKQLIIPFRMTDLELADESLTTIIVRLLKLFDFESPNDSGIFLYFIIRFDVQNARDSELFKTLKAEFKIQDPIILGEIKAAAIDGILEPISTDLNIRKQAKEKFIKHLNEKGKSLPAKFFDVEDALTHAINALIE